MATLTPKALIGPSAALTSSVTTYASNGSATTFGIIRTVIANSPTTAITLTIALGADAAGTRQWNAVALTQNVPYVFNGWVVTPTNSTHSIDATSNATGTNCICTISGYESA
jgi:hypothetical protein